MKVTLSTIGKFHTFDLARQLHARGALAGIYTGYPRFKLKNEGLPSDLVHTFPWLKTPYMAMKWRHKLPRSWVANWEHLTARTFDSWLARNLVPCQVYVGLSGSTLKAGLRQQEKGGKYVCDRGSSHIRYQNQLLQEEHALWGAPYTGIDPRTIASEEAEYAAADRITVPSGFVMQSFLRMGVAPERLSLLPYGVDLNRFKPTGQPAASRFDVLFVGGMSLRKGVQYLVQAYTKLKHPQKSLTFVGTPSVELIDLLRRKGIWPEDARVLGHMPQPDLKHLMSQSHVMVLPSLEEGLAMVMAQSMACGCPVVASEHTGALDLFSDGCEGFVVPIRQVDALADRLQLLADTPHIQRQMAANALQRVKHLGGWNTYGDKAMAAYQELVAV